MTASAFVHGEHPCVEARDGVQGRRPVIKGTRFPVSSIVQNHRRSLSVEEILREFPHLTPAQVHGALSFHYTYPEAIDEEIAKLTAPEQTAAQFPPTKTRAADDGS
jgi:uncharacterized protein (DUF433 family)